MDLAGAIAAIQTMMSGISGIKSAPTWAKESMPAMPFSICYPRSGTLEMQSEAFFWGLHTLYLEIHCNRSDLGGDLSLSVPFVTSIFAAFVANPTLSGSVREWNNLTYTYGKLEWAAIQTIGYRFELTVKI